MKPATFEHQTFLDSGFSCNNKIKTKYIQLKFVLILFLNNRSFYRSVGLTRNKREIRWKVRWEGRAKRAGKFEKISDRVYIKGKTSQNFYCCAHRIYFCPWKCRTERSAVSTSTEFSRNPQGWQCWHFCTYWHIEFETALPVSVCELPELGTSNYYNVSWFWNFYLYTRKILGCKIWCVIDWYNLPKLIFINR